MANLTIAIDDDLLKRARLRAVAQGTSVNAVLREYLSAFAGGDDELRRAVADVLAVAEKYHGGPGARAWTRDDLHAR